MAIIVVKSGRGNQGVDESNRALLKLGIPFGRTVAVILNTFSKLI